MNALYFIVIFFINANTGEFDHREVSKEPMTLELCTKALIERGPVKTNSFGLAQVGVCMRADKVNGHTDT